LSAANTISLAIASERHLGVGVVEDDERRIAAQFQRELFDCPGVSELV
jgi:hypothetical protein